MGVQTETVTFTGSESHQDILWAEAFSSFRLFAGVVTTDDTVVAIRLTNITDSSLPPDATGVRVEPTAPFSGEVSVLNIEVIP